MNSPNSLLERQYQIRPASFLLFDAEDKKMELERHFNDLYLYFIKRTANYATTNVVDTDEENKLKKILEELINVRRSLLS